MTCFRTSLAYVLKLPEQDVPDFVDARKNGTWNEMIEDNREWLSKRGLDLVVFWFHGSWRLEKLLDWWTEYNPGRAAVLAGNAGDESHAVAIMDGKIVVNTAPNAPFGPHKQKSWTDGYWFFYVVTHLRATQ